MSRIAEKPICSDEEKNILIQMSKSTSEEHRLVIRAKIVLMSAEGQSDLEISKILSLTTNTVRKWRNRFISNRLDGIHDLQRSGKPPIYDKITVRKAIFDILEKPPPKGQSVWDGKAIAAELKISADYVWKILREEGIHLKRQKTWCVSTDPQFTQKAADIIGLYLNPPENAIVISLDEKTSIQAIEHDTGYVLTNSGDIVRGIQSTYKRHGVVNLFGALEVATGKVHSSVTDRKRRIEFLEFMDQIVSEMPQDKDIHVILDNYCIHKRCDEWLHDHQNVIFHYTPTSASWLNLVEVFFGIFTRKALRGANFKNIKELVKAIHDFLEVYNQNYKPFVWRKREVKGCQLRNTITNLRN